MTATVDTINRASNPDFMSDFTKSFVSVLVADIIDARSLVAAADSAVNRRHLVRATFAGVEGLAWHCREHVREIARQMGHLTPLADLALREQTYTVTDHGEVIEQVRYLALATSIRLMVKQAAEFVHGFEVDFGSIGWQRLRAAIAIRHRITHPKRIEDLTLSDSDIDTVGLGFDWFLSVSSDLLEQTVASYANFVELARELVDQLKAGDPAALSEYHAALMRSED